MNKRLIVVPVDGSPLAERAVPYAVTFAKATGGSLLFVSVSEGTDVPPDAGRERQDEIGRQEDDYYRRYLTALAARFTAEGLETDTELRIGNPADEILRVIEQRDPQLLVMATHGRSGLGRWWYGSVASRLVREAPVPTLVIGPRVLEAESHAVAIRRILVPLDGSPLAEAALQPAVELADALGAGLMLAQVVHWINPTYVYNVPGFDVASLDRDLADAAQEYLARVRQSLGTSRPVDVKVLRGLPADDLISLVETEDLALVVMTSHSRNVVTRALLGSVADRLLQAAAPVLLVRPEGVTTVTEKARGRYCHNCGRASPYVQVLPDERCVRCGVHLRACANCVYHDGVACMLQRPEAHDALPGRNCAYFQFRETEAPESKPLSQAQRPLPR